jgi:hypothetical protein
VTSAGIERVDEVRRRLREMLGPRTDPAVRIVQLDAPSAQPESLVLNRRFTVVAELSEDAKHALGATVRSLYEGALLDGGLSGTVIIDGEIRALDTPMPEADSQRAGAAAIFRDHFDAVGANSIAWADPVDLRAVVDALETAIALTSAELRGADLVAREGRLRDVEPAEVVDLRASSERSEIDDTISALDQAASRPELFDSLEGLLHEIQMTAPIVTDDSAVEQYSAAIGRLLPTDSSATRAELHDKLDAATRLRDHHRQQREELVDKVVVALDDIGVDADRGNAIERAERVLVEREELGRLRDRLVLRLDATDPAAPEPEPELPPGVDAALERRRDQLRRRLQSQQRLLAATQEQLAFASRQGAEWSELPGRTVTPTNGDGRPLPILVEDPTVDLPSRHGASALSVLLRLSQLTQVICISDDPDLARWTREIGDRVDFVEAEGWFAGDVEP